MSAMTTLPIVIIVRPNPKGRRPLYVHAFTDRDNAVRFARKQEIPGYQLVESWMLTDPFDGRIEFLPQPEGGISVAKRFGNSAVYPALLDPFLARTASGEALWHVEIEEEGGRIGECFKAYSKGRCRAYLIPEPGDPHSMDWTDDGKSLVVHCFAVGQPRAEAIARELLGKHIVS